MADLERYGNGCRLLISIMQSGASEANGLANAHCGIFSNYFTVTPNYAKSDYSKMAAN